MRYHYTLFDCQRTAITFGVHCAARRLDKDIDRRYQSTGLGQTNRYPDNIIQDRSVEKARTAAFAGRSPLANAGGG